MMIIKNKILFIAFIVVSITLNAQTKKVAVWETKCGDNSITPFQSAMVRGGMETAVANASGYTGYDRASFDAILQEHNFQRSGAVKDSDIRRLGEMAGVQYIIVPEALVSGSDFYIIVKMLDVETGEYGAAYDALCGSSASEIKKACSELGVKLFGSNGGSAYTSTSPTNRPQSQSANNANGHEYVDLGLPSGTLWATCNLGASKPEDYGNYYAWGETSTKTTYSWDTYKYANSNSDKLTKYCNNSNYGNNGFTDNLTTLQAGDDPATANWGSGWRTPSEAQWDELLTNTTDRWTTRNGVEGWLFTSKKNGKTLFLPCSGFRDGNTSVNDMGAYWANSLYDYGGPVYAWFLVFNSENCGTAYNYRYGGFSVRPVREK